MDFIVKKLKRMKFKPGTRVIVQHSHDRNGEIGIIVKRLAAFGLTGEDRAWVIDFDGTKQSHFERNLKLAHTTWKERYKK